MRNENPVLTTKFKRSFRKFVCRNKSLQKRIEDTLLQMRTNVFSPNLATHKLEGELKGLMPCSCGYDCRIIFSLEKEQETGDEAIVLLDVGTHDEVY